MADRVKAVWRHFTPDFKVEAVKLVSGQGYSVPQACKRLEIDTKILYG